MGNLSAQFHTPIFQLEQIRLKCNDDNVDDIAATAAAAAATTTIFAMVNVS